jgi:epidermal growth factor receptor substrate 15
MPAPASPLPELPVRETQRSGTGDDVEPVKQLLAMGFDRVQAVEALEKYDYNVQRALNSLLGTR